MLTYEDCGVSPSKNDRLVEEIKNITNISTGFADTQTIPGTDMMIVQCMDGVGTKIRLAEQYPSLYDTIGQDLVAMCVNDLICAGAVPTYFQDYIGMNTLDEDVIPIVINSINDACLQGDVKLTGGEMAEMPGNYTHSYPELVGCATGFCTKEFMINKNDVKPGDILVGLKSSGPHSNGYSLIRNINTAYKSKFSDALLRSILEPTFLYYGVSEYYQSVRAYIHAIAHITGGGLESNLERVIPSGLRANIDYNSWTVPDTFNELQQLGDVDPDAMWETFNMGVGMVLIVDPKRVEYTIDSLPQYSAFDMGTIETV